MSSKKSRKSGEAVLNSIKTVTKQRTKRRMSKGKIKYNAELWGMSAIPIIWFIVFCYIPMVGILIAFKDYNYRLGIFASEWVGLKNFEFFLRSNDALIVTRNTIFLNILFTAVCTFCALLLAVLLYNLRSRLKTKIFQTIYITPNFVSMVVVAYIVYSILNPQYGVANQLITALGAKGVDWYAEPKFWPGILTIVNVWKGIGMSSVIYYSALMGIDETLFEAAKVDGANKFRLTVNVMIPSILPIIVIYLILSVGNIFRGDFGLFYLVTQDSALLYDVTDVVDTYVYRTLMESNNTSLSAAIGLLQSVVGCVLVLLTNWIANRVDKDLGLI